MTVKLKASRLQIQEIGTFFHINSAKLVFALLLQS